MSIIKVVVAAVVCVSLFMCDGMDVVKKLNAKDHMYYLVNDMNQLRQVGGDNSDHEAYVQYVNDSCMLESIYVQWPELR